MTAARSQRGVLPATYVELRRTLQGLANRGDSVAVAALSIGDRASQKTRVPVAPACSGAPQGKGAVACTKLSEEDLHSQLGAFFMELKSLPDGSLGIWCMFSREVFKRCASLHAVDAYLKHLRSDLARTRREREDRCAADRLRRGR